jgi:hypothetical protein
MNEFINYNYFTEGERQRENGPRINRLIETSGSLPGAIETSRTKKALSWRGNLYLIFARF